MSNAAVDFDSTLIRRGFHAATMSDMITFVETLEQRPLDKLLSELPGLARLSATKFDLSRQVIRRRARLLSVVEREQLRVFAHEIAETADAETAARIRGLLG